MLASHCNWMCECVCVCWSPNFARFYSRTKQSQEHHDLWRGCASQDSHCREVNACRSCKQHFQKDICEFSRCFLCCKWKKKTVCIFGACDTRLRTCDGTDCQKMSFQQGSIFSALSRWRLTKERNFDVSCAFTFDSYKHKTISSYSSIYMGKDGVWQHPAGTSACYVKNPMWPVPDVLGKSEVLHCARLISHNLIKNLLEKRVIRYAIWSFENTPHR